MVGVGQLSKNLVKPLARQFQLQIALDSLKPVTREYCFLLLSLLLLLLLSLLLLKR